MSKPANDAAARARSRLGLYWVGALGPCDGFLEVACVRDGRLTEHRRQAQARLLAKAVRHMPSAYAVDAEDLQRRWRIEWRVAVAVEGQAMGLALRRRLEECLVSRRIEGGIYDVSAERVLDTMRDVSHPAVLLTPADVAVLVEREMEREARV